MMMMMMMMTVPFRLTVSHCVLYFYLYKVPDIIKTARLHNSGCQTPLLDVCHCPTVAVLSLWDALSDERSVCHLSDRGCN
jgi:hypothetical protein